MSELSWGLYTCWGHCFIRLIVAERNGFCMSGLRKSMHQPPSEDGVGEWRSYPTKALIERHFRDNFPQFFNRSQTFPEFVLDLATGGTDFRISNRTRNRLEITTEFADAGMPIARFPLKWAKTGRNDPSSNSNLFSQACCDPSTST